MTAFTLVSIGQIDDTRYFVMFGRNICVIHNTKGDLIGHFPKSHSIYKVKHRSIKLAGAVVNGKMNMSLRELHEHMEHISVVTIRELVCKGMIEGIKTIKMIQTSSVNCV